MEQTSLKSRFSFLCVDLLLSWEEYHMVHRKQQILICCNHGDRDRGLIICLDVCPYEVCFVLHIRKIFVYLCVVVHFTSALWCIVPSPASKDPQLRLISEPDEAEAGDE